MKVGDLVQIKSRDNPIIKSWGLKVGVVVEIQGDQVLVQWATESKYWLMHPEELELVDIWQSEGCNPYQFISDDKGKTK